MAGFRRGRVPKPTPRVPETVDPFGRRVADAMTPDMDIGSSQIDAGAELSLDEMQRIDQLSPEAQQALANGQAPDGTPVRTIEDAEALDGIDPPGGITPGSGESPIPTQPVEPMPGTTPPTDVVTGSTPDELGTLPKGDSDQFPATPEMGSSEAGHEYPSTQAQMEAEGLIEVPTVNPDGTPGEPKYMTQAEIDEMVEGSVPADGTSPTVGPQAEPVTGVEAFRALPKAQQDALDPRFNPESPYYQGDWAIEKWNIGDFEDTIKNPPTTPLPDLEVPPTESIDVGPKTAQQGTVEDIKTPGPQPADSGQATWDSSTQQGEQRAPDGTTTEVDVITPDVEGGLGQKDVDPTRKGLDGERAKKAQEMIDSDPKLKDAAARAAAGGLAGMAVFEFIKWATGVDVLGTVSSALGLGKDENDIKDRDGNPMGTDPSDPSSLQGGLDGAPGGDIDGRPASGANIRDVNQAQRLAKRMGVSLEEAYGMLTGYDLNTGESLGHQGGEVFVGSAGDNMGGMGGKPGETRVAMNQQGTPTPKGLEGKGDVRRGSRRATPQIAAAIRQRQMDEQAEREQKLKDQQMLDPRTSMQGMAGVQRNIAAAILGGRLDENSAFAQAFLQAQSPNYARTKAYEAQREAVEPTEPPTEGEILRDKQAQREYDAGLSDREFVREHIHEPDSEQMGTRVGGIITNDYAYYSGFSEKEITQLYDRFIKMGMSPAEAKIAIKNGMQTLDRDQNYFDFPDSTYAIVDALPE